MPSWWCDLGRTGGDGYGGGRQGRAPVFLEMSSSCCCHHQLFSFSFPMLSMKSLLITNKATQQTQLRAHFHLSPGKPAKRTWLQPLARPPVTASPKYSSGKLSSHPKQVSPKVPLSFPFFRHLLWCVCPKRLDLRAVSSHLPAAIGSGALPSSLSSSIPHKMKKQENHERQSRPEPRTRTSLPNSSGLSIKREAEESAPPSRC